MNTTHMNVSWVKLTLEEARGFVTGYAVSYDAVELRRKKRELRREIVHPDSGYKVIGGLGFTESYSITVSASTSAGEGIASRPVVVRGMYVCMMLTVCVYSIFFMLMLSSFIHHLPVEDHRDR